MKWDRCISSLLLLTLVLCAGCNLSKMEDAAVAGDLPVLTAVITPRSTRTAIVFDDRVRPTPLPLIDSGSDIALQPTLIPVTSALPLNDNCQVYTTYSGSDPQNKLSLRSSASLSSPQVFRVPTNTQVMLVPRSQEMVGDNYHWLNVIYIDASLKRYQGWMARDSYMQNGVPDPSIATLRPTGIQAVC